MGASLYEEQYSTPLSERSIDRLRFTIWGVSAACALLSVNFLQYATALIGINSLLISVILPMLFYIQLHYHEMSWLTSCAATRRTRARTYYARTHARTVS